MIASMPSRRPPFRGQRVVDKPGATVLDVDGSTVVLVADVLGETQLAEYAAAAVRVERFGGRSGFGEKPRKEVCYTLTGRPYNYSGVSHPTTAYPPHVLAVVPHLLARFEAALGAENKFRTMDNAVDIVYDARSAKGGSVSAHRDDERPWGLVLILSLGQTRWLRVRSNAGEWTNVELRHNSLVAMHGAKFQQLYTHQVDKLYEGEPIGQRFSLNVRFLSA